VKSLTVDNTYPTFTKRVDPATRDDIRSYEISASGEHKTSKGSSGGVNQPLDFTHNKGFATVRLYQCRKM